MATCGKELITLLTIIMFSLYFDCFHFSYYPFRFSGRTFGSDFLLFLVIAYVLLLSNIMRFLQLLTLQFSNEKIATFLFCFAHNIAFTNILTII